jgi:RHS repeat-associated protein
LAWGEDISGRLQGAGGIGGLLATTANSDSKTENWMHFDSNGNVIRVSNALGKESARYQYDAFGKTILAQGGAANLNRYQFSTKPIERISGLAFYGFRYFSITRSRWLRRDVIQESGGINLFGFVDNNPINFIDRLGMETYGDTTTGSLVPNSANPSYDCIGHALGVQQPVTKALVDANTLEIDCDDLKCSCGEHLIIKYSVPSLAGSSEARGESDPSLHYYKLENDGTYSCKYGEESVYNNIADTDADYKATYWNSQFKSTAIAAFFTDLLGAEEPVKSCYCAQDYVQKP